MGLTIPLGLCNCLKIHSFADDMCYTSFVLGVGATGVSPKDGESVSLESGEFSDHVELSSQ